MMHGTPLDAALHAMTTLVAIDIRSIHSLNLARKLPFWVTYLSKSHGWFTVKLPFQVK